MTTSISKVAFLVGAGLVVDAGLPTAVGLTEQFREFLKEESAKDPSARYAGCLSVYNLLVGGIRFQDGTLNRDPDVPVNIERLATTALYLKRRLESPLAPYTSGWHQRLVEIESKQSDALNVFLQEMFTKLNDWLTPPDTDRLAYLARFSDFVNEPWNVSIFSLNYDLCIETALRDIAHKRFINGFNESGWKPESLNDESVLRLIKLHGSLDWVDDEAFGICSLQFPRCDNAEDIEGTRPPLLIFGTDNKMTGRDPFLTLLYQFSSRLNSSDVLVTVGYSFGDEYLNQVIEQRLANNPRLRVVVVSPNAERLVSNTKFLVGSPRVATLQETARTAFQEYRLLQKVRSVLEGASDEEPFTE